MTTTPFLLWFAGYSNITSIFIVAVCFLFMTVFIGFVRMHGDFHGSSRLPIGTSQRDMVKVPNPFVVKLMQQDNKLQDGLQLVFSMLCDCHMVVLWGPLIQPLHELILQLGTDVYQECWEARGSLYTQLDCLDYDRLQMKHRPGQQKVSLPCPDTVSSTSLGDMPRTRYPVVVMTFVPPEGAEAPAAKDGTESPETLSCDGSSRHQDDEDLGNREDEQDFPMDTNRIIGLISIVHLRDDKVEKASCVLNQYVKTAGVSIFSLQPLYLCGGNNTSPEAVPQPIRENQSSDTASMDERQNSGSHAEGNDSGISFEAAEEPSTHETDASAAIDSFSNLRQRHTKDSQQGSLLDEGTCSTNSIDEIHSKRFSVQSLETTRTMVKTTQPLPECVVCQTRPVTCAILPCRHACVCSGCFKLLTRCPMCRGALVSYFVLRDSELPEVEEGEVEEEDSVLQEFQQQAMNQHFWQLWENWNMRLNHFLGFR